MKLKHFGKQCRFWLVAAIGLSVFAVTVRGVNLVQDFYLPMPEQQIYQADSAIASGIGSTISSTFSIIVTGSGTTIYFDQWEDGYETDLGNPAQSTTQIWGDGNDANGIPPGMAHDPAGLSVGTIITLTNNVALPRNPSTILWDARDHFAATKAVVLTRAGWPVNPGPVFAGAVSVLSTLDYGTNYVSPVGQNLPANLFKYVGLFVMAAQNNTALTIDPNGNGVGVTNIVLNQGESYLVNGGVKKGGRVTSSKPVQADLIVGHVGATYANDWFTLYPVEAWDDTYYTPVGSASTVSQPAYVYLYNPNSTNITVNYNTLSGSGSLTVPATNTYQFQMPVSSGASFICNAGAHFYALCTVAANNSSDTPWNWGFTLLPKDGLTTEAQVGWAPGSANGTVNGNPVWVTTLANARIYVDYKGDHSGPLTDPNGNHYDTNFDLTTLQSKKIYDPSRDQSGMRVYTVDSTRLTAAWGEDADKAAPGNPYIDAGYTVLPFPVPVLNKSAVIVTDAPPAGLSIGDTIQYTIQVDNRGLLPLGNTLVIDAPSTNLQYVTNTATFNGTPIPDNVSGTPFPLDAPGYTIPIILRGGTTIFQYDYTVIAGGVVSNGVNIGGTTITSTSVISPPPTNGASVSLNFTDTNGVNVVAYAAGANVFVTMTNAVGNTSSGSAQTISVTVVDLTHGDQENIPLLETGNNTGIFRNVAGLPTSTSTGLSPQDGALNVSPGDTLSVAYTDPTYGDSASNTAAILIPALTKQLYLSAAGTNGAQNLNRVDPVFYGHSPAQTSVDLGGGTAATIGIDGSASVATNGGSLTISYTTGSGANGLMLVSVGTDQTHTISSVTYNGVALTSVTSGADGGSTKPRVEIFRLLNPPSGAHNLVLTAASSGNLTVGITTFTNVDQTTPLGTAATTSVTSSGTVTSAVGQLVFGTICAAQAETDSAGQTTRWSTNATATIYSVGSTKPGTNSVTISWTPGGGANKAAVIVVPIQPAITLSGGVTSTSFTQTPAFCSAFTMPSNNLVTITNYITVTNGVMPTNPAITATLQANGTNFITLANPTYNAASSNLVWSGLLNSSVTVPAGQSISYVISNNEAGVSFHINYDSTNAPSKITLPASTVINVDTLGIYDAPYPGGSLVTSPVAGTTLYVRADVSDPFGGYDITSVGLAITAPNPSGDVNVSLTNANVVASDSCSKTYEYTWQTGLPDGSYNLVATANEGTEGVTATAAASVSLIVLDTGTPSTTEFTSGNNGSATNSYLADSSVCVRVTDLDQNTDSNAVETVIATVTSSTGDSELLTLAETSANSGVFTGCINSSTSSGATTNDGTLFAPVGSIIAASYTDPNDSSDTSSVTGIIQPAPGVPGVTVNKTIVSPSGGQVGLNQPVTYNLQVVNTGSTTLTNVGVTDNFDSATLSYSSATPTPDTTGSGILTWSSLGNFAPGQSTNISVTFTTLAIGTVTNSATVNGGTATNSSVATVFVSHSALNVTKILLSPTNQPVAVGSNVVFRITIQNVGNTTVATLPLEDNFSAAYFQFVSATIPPDGSGAGSLLWTNLAPLAGLATNAIITNDVIMTVVGQGNPANNTAVADFAVDEFGNPVPSASGSVDVVTAAASINGYVYNDIDQSGIFTNGDTGLSGVALQLFSDPNGDGDPSDGTLVQLTSSDANGYYEFVNLNLGKYVVVATALPGYSFSAPVSGRQAFDITSLTASANNYFFQYQPSAVLYSTFSGVVWDDVAGGGTNYPGQTGLAGVTVDLVQDVNSNGVADLGEPVVNSATTDAGGNYSFAGITPGGYVISETVPAGYYLSGDAQLPSDGQIGFATTNGIVVTNNDFFNRLLPTAVDDSVAGYYLVPMVLEPLTNDISPNGDVLTILNVVATGGVVVINPGATNLTFTPTNVGVATIVYTNADGHGGTSSAVITVNVTALADLGIGKSAVGSVAATSNLVYTISVTNFGPSAADSVTVTDAIPAGAVFVDADSGGTTNNGVVTWDLGILANGAVTNLTLTVTVPADGSLANVAGVSSPTSDSNPGNNTNAPVVTTISGVADVAVGKSGAASVSATNNLTYTISVTNLGPSIASGVAVTDAIPAGAIFVSASGGGVTNGGVVTWNLGDLANGAVSNVILTVIAAPATGSLTNVASAGSTAVDPDLSNNSSTPVVTLVVAVTVLGTDADIGIGKRAAGSVAATSNLVYTISVTNFGPLVANSVTVTDAIPAGATFVVASGGGVTNGGVVTWNLGDLASGAVSNVTLTVKASSPGSLTNVASVGSVIADSNPTNNFSPPVVTTVTNVSALQADLAVFKTGSTNGFRGSNVVYTITVTNRSPNKASNIVVFDALPIGMTFSSGTVGTTVVSNVVSWSVAKLAAHAVTNFTLTAQVVAIGVLTNTAYCTSTTFDSSPANNDGSKPFSKVVTTVVPVPFGIGANMTKISRNTYRVGAGAFNPQTGLYEESVTVTNTGLGSIPGFKLFVGGLRPNVTLYNAKGSNSVGTPYVEYDGLMASNSAATLMLKFYNPFRVQFTNTLTVVALTHGVNPATISATNGAFVNAVFRDIHGRLVLAFRSVPGATYTVIYATNLAQGDWFIAVPSIKAGNNITQWEDDGPPSTIGKPFTPADPSRYYRVIKN